MENLILFPNPIRYALSRIRFLILQRSLATLVRGAEWIVFAHMLTFRHATVLILVRQLKDLIGNFRWSGLEHVRNEIREFKDSGNRQGLNRLILSEWKTAWLGFLIILVFGGLIFSLLFSNDNSRFSGLSDELKPYWLALFAGAWFQMAVDWILKTLQAFIIPTHRIFRPFAVTLIFESAHIFAIIFLGTRYGPISYVVFYWSLLILRSLSSYIFFMWRYRSIGRPPLSLQRGVSFTQWRGSRFITGLSHLSIELSFLACTISMGLILPRIFPDFPLWRLIYFVSPFLLSFTSIPFLYYTDFSRFSNRTLQKVKSFTLKSAIYALAMFSVFTWGVLAFFMKTLSNEWFLIEPLEVTAGGFIWGLFSILAVYRFVEGVRLRLIIAGVVVAIPVLFTSAPDGFLISCALSPILGILLLLFRVKDSTRTTFTPKRAFFSNRVGSSVQGVRLDQEQLGFSLQKVIHQFIPILSKGSNYTLLGKNQLYWCNGDGKPLSTPRVIEALAPYCLEWLDIENTRVSAEESDAGTLWVYPSPLPGKFNLFWESLSSVDQQLWISQMIRMIMGKKAVWKKAEFRFSPAYENGVWVGGYFYAQTGKNSELHQAFLDVGSK